MNQLNSLMPALGQDLLNDIMLVRKEWDQCLTASSYTNKELASELGVCRNTLYKWRRKGMLNYEKKEGRIFYNKQDIMDYITLKEWVIFLNTWLINAALSSTSTL